MNKKKNLIIISISTVLLIVIISLLLVNNSNNNFIRLNYNKVKEMINNKETFTLCISRTTCTYCQSFKPKLKDISKKYDIKIYYIELDKESKENQEDLLELLSFDGKTPTTIFIKDGEETTSANRIKGDSSKTQIINKLKSNKIIE